MVIGQIFEVQEKILNSVKRDKAKRDVYILHITGLPEIAKIFLSQPCEKSTTMFGDIRPINSQFMNIIHFTKIHTPFNAPFFIAKTLIFQWSNNRSFLMMFVLETQIKIIDVILQTDEL